MALKETGRPSSPLTMPTVTETDHNPGRRPPYRDSGTGRNMPNQTSWTITHLDDIPTGEPSRPLVAIPLPSGCPTAPLEIGQEARFNGSGETDGVPILTQLHNAPGGQVSNKVRVGAGPTRE